MADKDQLPLFEVFIRSKLGLDHKHAGSLHAEDHEMALQYARDVYTRRSEGVSGHLFRLQCVKIKRSIFGFSMKHDANT